MMLCLEGRRQSAVKRLGEADEVVVLEGVVEFFRTAT